MEPNDASARYAVVCNAEQVGYAELAASHGEDLAESLRVASTACTLERLDGNEAAPQPSQKWSTSTECAIDERPEDAEGVPKTPCTYNIAIGVAHDIAEDMGLESKTDFDRLMADGYEPAEAEAAFAKFVREVRQVPSAGEEATSWSDTFVEVFNLPNDKEADNQHG